MVLNTRCVMDENTPYLVAETTEIPAVDPLEYLSSIPAEELEDLLKYATPKELEEWDRLMFAPASPYIPQTPTERQALFLSLQQEREVFYGGAAGGGKSSALLMAALEFVHVRGYSALLLRRTYTDLSKPGALMDRANEWLRNTGAKWNEQKKQWRFPSGAVLTFGYLETENDKYSFQSAEYQFIGFDELSQFTESQYLYLFSRLRRLAGSDIPLRMRAGSNPGGTGGRWVYHRFIPEGFSPIDAQKHRVWWHTGQDEDNRPFRRAFVPARLHDNPHLDQAEYVEALQELDSVTREQLLSGDWQITERGDILTTYRERHTVIGWTQFERVLGCRHIPETWLLDIYQDAGMTEAHPCVTSWFASAPMNIDLDKRVLRESGGLKMGGSVFLYRGMTVHDMTTKQRANEINRLMAPHGETSRTQRWQMSHEAADERVGYQREHGLPFQPWPTGKTRGVAQLRTAFELRDTDRANPFNPDVGGHPLLYLVVDDEQLGYARDDAGLARHRAEIPAYHWAMPKSGDAPASLVPYALFNDAIDTMRAAAADYWPEVTQLSYEERVHAAIPAGYHVAELQERSDMDPAQRALTAWWAEREAKKRLNPKTVDVDDYGEVI